MTTRVPVGIFFALFTVSGFAGLIYESIWSHYLKLFLGHAAYAQTLVLAIFMGGMAIGSWLVSRYTHRIRNLLVGYAFAEFGIGILAILFHRVFQATMNVPERLALAHVQAGDDFGSLCAGLATVMPAEQAAGAAGALVLRWIEDQLLAADPGP